MPKIVFVKQDVVGEDIRTRELRRAAARSHAARVAHIRKQKLKKPNSQSSCHEEPPCSCSRCITATQLDVSICKSRFYRAARDRECKAIKCSCKTTDDERTNSSRHYSLARKVSVKPELMTDLDKLAPTYQQLSKASGTTFAWLTQTPNLMTDEFFCFMSDEAVYHAGAALIKYEHNCLVQPKILSQDVLRHKSKALSIIRQRLQHSPVLDNATLLAILVLPNCEDLETSVESFIFHWTAVAKLIAARLETDSIEARPGGEYLNTVIACAKPCLKAMTGINMPVEVQSMNSAPSRPSVEFQVSNLPQGLKELLDSHKIGDPTLAMLESLEQLSVTNSTLPRAKPRASSFQEAWSTFELTPSSVEGEPCIEEVIQVALPLFALRPFGPAGLMSIIPRSFRNVSTQSMPGYVFQRSLDEERALYWSWTVIVDSWKTRFGELSDEGKELLELQIKRFPTWTRDPIISTEILKAFKWDTSLLHFHERCLSKVRTQESNSVL